MSTKEIIQTLYEVPPPQSSKISLDKPQNAEVFVVEKQTKKKKRRNVLYEVSPPMEMQKQKSYELIEIGIAEKKKKASEPFQIEFIQRKKKTSVEVQLIENPKPRQLFYEIPKPLELLPSPDNMTLKSVRLPKATRNFNPFNDYTNTLKFPRGRQYKKYEHVYDNHFSDDDFPRYFENSAYSFSEQRMPPYNGNHYNNTNILPPEARRHLMDVYPEYEYETDFRNQNPSDHFAKFRKQPMNENPEYQNINIRRITSKSMMHLQMRRTGLSSWLLLLPLAFIVLQGLMFFLWMSCKKQF